MANNGNTSAEISQNILDAFEILAKAEVNSAQFDKTITGIIVSCEDEASGRYRVQYQNSIFYAYSSALDITYSKGTSVQVKIPNNDFSGRKIIIGTVEENGIDYGTIVEDPLLRYETIGIDCIKSTDRNNLSTYWNEDKNNIILYDLDNHIDKINLDTEMVSNNITLGNSVLLGASIKTNIPYEQRFYGNYGIKYTFTFNDLSNVNSTVDRYYIVDIDKMSGDPYGYEDEVEQIIPFDIDNKNFLYVKKIELFAKNFPYQDNNKDADIFISNIRFQVANRLSDEEFTGTALTVLTPEGNYFKANENLNSKSVIAQLRIKGKITEGTIKKIQYYWFIEDLTVDKSSNIAYQKYGGRGWRCLNKFNVTEGDENNPISVQYVNGENTFSIKKSNSNAREIKYKIIVVYNGSILEKEFSFINYDITDEVKIIYDRNPNFIDSIGATTLTCIATNGITYKWAKIDAEGGFESLNDTAAENIEYNNAVINLQNLRNDIINKIKADNDINRALLKSYQNVIDKYDYIGRIEKNKIINLQAGTIFKEALYKCQAFDNAGRSLGIASQLVTNYLKQGEDEQSGNLFINNGNQVFKYDAKGISPTSEIFDNPQIITPLSFTLRTADGIEIPQTAIKDTDISWIVPIKNTLIKSYIGSIVSHDEELGIEIYNGKSLSYTISENYYTNKDNNEIELQVKYQGILYIAKTNLLFIKDGESGTNGTNYVLKLIPSSDTIGRLKVAKNNETGSDWLRAQLWYNGIKIYEGYGSGIASSTGKNVDVKWSIIGDKRATHNITVTSNGSNPPIWKATATQQTNATDIAKATVTYDGMTIIATMPIIYSTNLNSSYKVSLKEGTGYTHVIYSEDGHTPIYESNSPFEISVQKLINNQWGDLTGHNSLTYQWSTIGNLRIKKGYSNTDKSIMIEPYENYESETTHHAIICTIKENSTTIATLHIPIHFLLNTYGHSAINEWDGNSIQLDADGNTMLLAPQGGFGKKEADNSYTGILLGTTKDYTNGGLEHTGIFGYNSGIRTIFLNSENGSAIFGSTGSSQIMIDPTIEYIKGKKGAALLYSNDFYKSYDTKTGLPLSYASSNENKKGALIDLTTPQIRWGNGNFKVNQDGHITAKGGGDIAGWYISNTELYKGDVHFSSDNTTITNWAIKIGKNNDNPLFGVNYNGLTQMQTAQIGSGSNQITIGKENGSTTNSAIYRGKNSLKAATSGFYLGNNGLALGTTTDYKNITNSTETDTHSKFEVTSSGTVYASDVYLKGRITATSGYIGNGSSGWTIKNNYIYNTKNSLNNSSTAQTVTGVYIGTNGIGLGNVVAYGDDNASDYHSNFEVDSSGRLYAKNGTFRGKITSTSGSIGGWTISSNSLKGGNITLNSNGSISGGSTYTWSIGTNGTATFNKITGNNADINGKITATSGKIGNWTISNGGISNGSVSLTSDGKINASGGTIGGWNIDSVQFQKQIGQHTFEIRSDRSTDQPALLVYKNQGDNQGYKFYVRPDGFLYAQNADIHGTITATSGTFQNCTVADSCSVPASTITGTLASERIPNLSASKITSGTMSANRISGGTLNISTTGGGEFSVGTNGRKNAYATGLTTGSGGIAMNGSAGISGCSEISGLSSLTGSGTISISAPIKVTGGTTTDSLTVSGNSTFGSVSFTGGIIANGSSGKTVNIQGGVVLGQDDLILKFTYGILTSASGNWVA